MKGTEDGTRQSAGAGPIKAARQQWLSLSQRDTAGFFRINTTFGKPQGEEVEVNSFIAELWFSTLVA